MDIEVRDTELLGSADGNYTVSATIQIVSGCINSYTVVHEKYLCFHYKRLHNGVDAGL